MGLACGHLPKWDQKVHSEFGSAVRARKTPGRFARRSEAMQCAQKLLAEIDRHRPRPSRVKNHPARNRDPALLQPRRGKRLSDVESIGSRRKERWILQAEGKWGNGGVCQATGKVTPMVYALTVVQRKVNMREYTGCLRMRRTHGSAMR